MVVLSITFGVNDPNPSGSMSRHPSVFAAIQFAEAGVGERLNWSLSEDSLQSSSSDGDSECFIEEFDENNAWHCEAE